MSLQMAVASGKGGVGKSTVSSTIAIEMARRGHRVVAVDADADAPNLHIVLGVREWRSVTPYVGAKIARIVDDRCTRCGDCLRACTYDAIYVLEDGRYRINPVLCEGCSACSLVCRSNGAIVREAVDSGSIMVADTAYGFPLVSARLNPGRPNSGKLVTEEKDIAGKMAGEGSVIVLDSAAGIGCQVVSSLAGAHMVVLVAEPTPTSLSDMKRVYQLAKHFMMPAAMVINKYDINEGFVQEIERFASESGIEIIGRVPFDDAVPRSMAIMKPLVEASPDSPAAAALRGVAGRVAAIAADWRSWWFAHKPKRPEPYKPLIVSPGKG